MASDANDILSTLTESFAESVEAGRFDSELNDFMANDVVPVFKENYPVLTGEGRDSIGVTQLAEGGRGQVGATDEAASFVEWGTEDTPEFAPMRRTVEFFNNGQAR